ncbi:MAG: hypothetical protein ABIA93_07320 [Candidatus Woesearchaeota archaeon]
MIYVFGNEYLQEDSMARKVSEHLDVSVMHCRSPDDLLDVQGEMVILDVVKGTDKPIVLHGTDKIKTRNLVSMHDFDLGYFFKLLKELGQEPSVTIIGVPEKGDPELIAKEVREWI